MEASQYDRPGHHLQVVAAASPEGRLVREPRSVAYERVVREVGRRVDQVHRVLRGRGDVLPQSLPAGRNLTAQEIEELAWRVYTLACVTRTSLARCHPALVLMAAEWLSSTEPRVWEAFCEMQLSP